MSNIKLDAVVRCRFAPTNGGKGNVAWAFIEGNRFALPRPFDLEQVEALIEQIHDEAELVDLEEGSASSAALVPVMSIPRPSDIKGFNLEFFLAQSAFYLLAYGLGEMTAAAHGGIVVAAPGLHTEHYMAARLESALAEINASQPSPVTAGKG